MPTGAAGAGRRDRASCGLEEQAKVFRHVPGGRVPLGRPLRQRLEADPFQFLGDRVVDLPRWTSLGLVSTCSMISGSESPRNGLSPGQQLVEDDAQAEDVRTPIDPVTLAPGLLGAHVGGCSSQPATLAEVLVPEGKPEVGDDTACPRRRSGCWRA